MPMWFVRCPSGVDDVESKLIPCTLIPVAGLMDLNSSEIHMPRSWVKRKGKSH